MPEGRFTWTSLVRPICQVGLGDPRAAEPTSWFDATCYVHEAEIFRGRERFNERFQPATASITFDNRNGWGDLIGAPAVVATATLRPGRPLRIGVVGPFDDGPTITRWLFRGWIDQSTPAYDPVLHDVVTVSCIDALGEAGQVEMMGGPTVGANETVTARMHRALDGAYWFPTKRKIGTSLCTVQSTDLSGRATDRMTEAADSDGGVVFGDLDGDVVFKALDWELYDPTLPHDGVIGNVGEDTAPLPDDPVYIDPVPGYVYQPDPPPATHPDIRVCANGTEGTLVQQDDVFRLYLEDGRLIYETSGRTFDMGPFEGGCVGVTDPPGDDPPVRIEPCINNLDPDGEWCIPPQDVTELPVEPLVVELIAYSDGGPDDPFMGTVTVGPVTPGPDCLLILMSAGIADGTAAGDLAPVVVTGGGLEWPILKSEPASGRLAQVFCHGAQVGRDDPGEFSVIVDWDSTLPAAPAPLAEATAFAVTATFMSSGGSATSATIGPFPTALENDVIFLALRITIDGELHSARATIAGWSWINGYGVGSDPDHPGDIYRWDVYRHRLSQAEITAETTWTATWATAGPWSYLATAVSGVSNTSQPADMVFADSGIAGITEPDFRIWYLAQNTGNPAGSAALRIWASYRSWEVDTPVGITMLDRQKTSGWDERLAVEGTAAALTLFPAWPPVGIPRRDMLVISGHEQGRGASVTITMRPGAPKLQSLGHAICLYKITGGYSPGLLRELYEGYWPASFNAAMPGNGPIAHDMIDDWSPGPRPIRLGDYTLALNLTDVTVHPYGSTMEPDEGWTTPPLAIDIPRRIAWNTAVRTESTDPTVRWSDVNIGDEDLSSAQGALLIPQQIPIGFQWRPLNFVVSTTSLPSGGNRSIQVMPDRHGTSTLVVFVSAFDAADKAANLTVTCTGYTFTRQLLIPKTGSSWAQGAVFTAPVDTAALEADETPSIIVHWGATTLTKLSFLVYEVMNYGGFGTSGGVTLGTHLSNTVTGPGSFTLPAAPGQFSVVLSALFVSTFNTAAETGATPGIGWDEEVEYLPATTAWLQGQSRTLSLDPIVSWFDVGTTPATDAVAMALEITPGPEFAEWPLTGPIEIGGSHDAFNGPIYFAEGRSGGTAGDPNSGEPIWVFPP